MLHHRFFSTVAIVATSSLLFAACGSTDPLVLSLKSSQTNSGLNRADPSSAQSAEDARLAFAQDISYSVINELPDLGDTGTAWSVNPLKTNKGLLKRLAVSFGLTGDLVKEDKYNFSIDHEDKTGAGLWLYVDASSASWSYSSGSVGSATTSSPVCPPNAECADVGNPVVAPKPPVNLPDEATAIARVTQLLTVAGMRVKLYSLSATKSEWSTDVVGTLMIGEVSTNMVSPASP